MSSPDNGQQSGNEPADRLRRLIEETETNARFNSMTRPQRLADMYAEARTVLHDLAPHVDEVRVEEVLERILDPLFNMLTYDVSAIAMLSGRLTKLQLEFAQVLTQHLEIEERLARLESGA